MFQGGYSDADHFRFYSSIVVTRCTAAHFVYCFHVKLALWTTSKGIQFAYSFHVKPALLPSSSLVAHFAYRFHVKLAVWPSSLISAYCFHVKPAMYPFSSMTAKFAYFCHVKLAFWPYFVMAAHFSFCFLSVCTTVPFGLHQGVRVSFVSVKLP